MKRLGTAGAYTAIFAVLGPLIGAVWVLLYMQKDSPSFSELLDPGVLLVYVFLVFGAYILGFIPSAITGLALGLAAYQWRLNRAMHALVGFGIGFLMCALYQVALAAMKDNFAGVGLDIPIIGALSGSMCGFVASFIEGSPNNSFKPTPLRDAA